MPTPNHWICRLDTNKKGRDFIVGDLHGCLQEFLLLLAHVHFNPRRDRVFCVGDLVDRGSHSRQCLELLYYPWFFSVRGNHEQMLLDHWEDPDNNPAYDPRWLTDISDDDIVIYKHLISKMPYIYYIQGVRPFFILHAELWDFERPLTDDIILDCKFTDPQQAKAKALWSRHIISAHLRASPETFHDPQLSHIFCGHTIVQMPMHVEQSIYIDTGAFVPYFDPLNSNAEHFGMTLIQADTLHHWFAPTNSEFRGNVVSMGPLHTRLNHPLAYTLSDWELSQ